MGRDSGAFDTILGVWDCGAFAPSVGGVLLLLEELAILKSRHKAARIVFCAIGAPFDAFPTGQQIAALDAGSDLLPPAFMMVADCGFADGVFAVPSWDQVGGLADKGGGRTLVWPEREAVEHGHYRYGSTISVQELYREDGVLPALSCSGEMAGRARDFMRENVSGDRVITVHLKNGGGGAHESDADFKEWEVFFRAAVPQSRCSFVVVGNDEIPHGISALPGVIIASERGSELSLDLALIEHSSGFMGMASGLCQMAMFNAKPYVIFKHPDHHPEEMARELGDNIKFSFAHPHQYIKRMKDTAPTLLAEFAAIYPFMAPLPEAIVMGNGHG